MIELRFGLTGGQPCTLEEVGKAFGVTRERIRQIENNTLKKLESLPEAQATRATGNLVLAQATRCMSEHGKPDCDASWLAAAPATFRPQPNEQLAVRALEAAIALGRYRPAGRR